MDIKIQSITDVITNSSTEIYTIYTKNDIATIKKIVNALLSVNGDSTFDDLFEIELLINDSVFEYLWEDSKEIQEQYPNRDDFYDYLEELNDEAELDRLEDIWYDTHCWDCYMSFYDGYSVSIKPEIEKTEKLEKAMQAIQALDSIFSHEVSYG